MLKLQRTLKGSQIKIYTDGSYKPTTDQGGYASIITENNQVINSVAFIANDIKVGDFVKVIGFFYDGFYNIQFYCKGINKIITNNALLVLHLFLNCNAKVRQIF